MSTLSDSLGVAKDAKIVRQHEAIDRREAAALVVTGKPITPRQRKLLGIKGKEPSASEIQKARKLLGV